MFNCGQGDALRLSFQDCYWDETPLYIDLGPSNYVAPIKDEEIDLLITHSHLDHVSGRPNLIPKVRRLYVPAYYPEVRKIVAALTKKPMSLPLAGLPRAELVFDGMRHSDCNHIAFLNPPLDPSMIFGLDEVDLGEVEEYLERHQTSVDAILQSTDDLAIGEVPQGYDARRFVQLAVSRIASWDTGSTYEAIENFVEYDANKISVVFSYSDDEISYLLTGDADKSVFNRLIKRREPRLAATVLKVPHHGSRHSLNKKILKRIAPKIALVSHKNGLFGKAKDPHPNGIVLKLFSQEGIDDYYTNDVIKYGYVLRTAKSGLIPQYRVEIS